MGNPEVRPQWQNWDGQREVWIPLASVKPWSSSTSRAAASESLERLQDFPRDSSGPSGLLRWNWGEAGLLLQLLRYHSGSHDQRSHGGGVPPWSPSPQLPFGAVCAGLDNLPLLPRPAHTGSQSTHFKIPLCASELVACELGDEFLLTPHPEGCKAALKSRQKSVLPTSPAGRGEEGSPLHLPGCKDELSPSAGQEDCGLKLLPKAGVTDRCCQSVLNSG